MKELAVCVCEIRSHMRFTNCLLCIYDTFPLSVSLPFFPPLLAEYGGHGQQQGKAAVWSPPTRELQTATDRPVSSSCLLFVCCSHIVYLLAPAFIQPPIHLHENLICHHTCHHKPLVCLLPCIYIKTSMSLHICIRTHYITIYMSLYIYIQPWRPTIYLHTNSICTFAWKWESPYLAHIQIGDRWQKRKKTTL